VILSENKATDLFYLIKQGQIKLTKKVELEETGYAKKVVLTSVFQGEMVGEDSLMASMPGTDADEDSEEEGPARMATSFYAAKVASREGATVYAARASEFVRTFPKMLPELRKVCSVRREFLVARF